MISQFTRRDLLKLRKNLKFCESKNRMARIRGRLEINSLKNKFSKITFKKMMKEIKEM